MLRSPLRSPLSSPLSSPTGSTPVNPNLLAGLSWIQGAETTLTIVGGQARAAKAVSSNPRIYKHYVGPVPGNILLNGLIYKGTAATSVRLRISTTVEIPTGDIFEFIESGADHTFANHALTINATDFYIGIVAVCSTIGEYGAIDDLFSMTRA